ncbi:MAG: hypothetical protein OEM61_06615 [Desulfobacteraceae bacterium]|nr:hypothetical protein [Desulfobacteraceae bacterium]MDH3567013.1 hypothetical protein [Desulfobacteraceae bacterium]
MDSLLNAKRPAVFCPGCSHDRVLHALDKALTGIGYAGKDVAIVTDIGCSGLFDTFFNTHAFHAKVVERLTHAAQKVGAGQDYPSVSSLFFSNFILLSR